MRAGPAEDEPENYDSDEQRNAPVTQPKMFELELRCLRLALIEPASVFEFRYVGGGVGVRPGAGVGHKDFFVHPLFWLVSAAKAKCDG